MRIVSRVEYGLPAEVRSSSGLIRPVIHNCDYLTAHYTGVDRRYAITDTAQEILNIQRVFADTKPFEYNYVLGQHDDGKIFEFAGKHRAAHSGGENSISFGVLFLNGVNEPVTDAQVAKWHWLRDWLESDGSLNAIFDQVRHRDMPGAATACPGAHVDAAWDRLTAPTPTTEKDTPVIAYIAKPPADMPGNPPWMVCINGSVRYATNVDSQYALDNKWAFVRLNHDQYNWLLKGANLA